MVLLEVIVYTIPDRDGTDAFRSTCRREREMRLDRLGLHFFMFLDQTKRQNGKFLPIVHPLRFPCMHYHQCKSLDRISGFYNKPPPCICIKTIITVKSVQDLTIPSDAMSRKGNNSQLKVNALQLL